MPKRDQTPRERRIRYEFLIERDGNRCRKCGYELPKNLYLLEIDHINGDEHDWRPLNLGLACRSCNASMGALLQKQRVKAGARVVSHARARADIDAADPNAPLAINQKFHDDAKAWMEGQVRAAEANGETCDKEDLSASAAELFHLSIPTTKRYLKESCSSVGVLMEIKDARGNVAITLKPQPPGPAQVRLDGSYQTQMEIKDVHL
jgi:hypothetical protein